MTEAWTSNANESMSYLTALEFVMADYILRFLIFVGRLTGSIGSKDPINHLSMDKASMVTLGEDGYTLEMMKMDAEKTYYGHYWVKRYNNRATDKL